jgi:hypothetical protein
VTPRLEYGSTQTVEEKNVYLYPIRIQIDAAEYLPQPRLTVSFTNAHRDIASELSALSEHAGLSTQHGRVGHAVGPDTDWASLTKEFVAFVGAAGGIRGIAAVLKVFFERNKGKTVQFGEHGQILRADGLSAEEITQLIESLPRAQALLESLDNAEADESAPDETLYHQAPESDSL